MSGAFNLGPPDYGKGLLYLTCLAALVIGGSGSIAISGYL